jgi:catechol 2,3-dioxygenase-like lactoylglutathione lyase family enzyme
MRRFLVTASWQRMIVFALWRPVNSRSYFCFFAGVIQTVRLCRLELSHDGSGPVHIGFGIPSESLPAWRTRLAEHGIAIESTITWPRGGTSIYFRDPDGHLLELVTPGIWEIY